MTTIAGVRIHPGYFKKAPIREGPRVGATVGNFRLKKTLTRAPAPLRALYAMPVIAVVAAIGSIAVAVPVVAAAVAAGTITLGAIAAGVTILGGVLTIAGAITGNENLIKYGGIISLVGGVGTIAAGAFGAGAGAAGEISADAAVNMTAVPGETSMSQIAGVPTANPATSGIGATTPGGVSAITATPAPGAPPGIGALAGTPPPPAPAIDAFNANPTSINNGLATQTPDNILNTRSTLQAPGPAQPGMLDSMGSFMTDSRFKPLWEMASKIPSSQQRDLQQAQIDNYGASTARNQAEADRINNQANRWNPHYVPRGRS